MSGHFFKDRDGVMCWASNPNLANVSKDDAENGERRQKEQARVKRLDAFVSENGSFVVGGVEFYATGDGSTGMRQAGRSFAEIIMDKGHPLTPNSHTDD